MKFVGNLPRWCAHRWGVMTRRYLQAEETGRGRAGRHDRQCSSSFHISSDTFLKMGTMIAYRSKPKGGETTMKKVGLILMAIMMVAALTGCVAPKSSPKTSSAASTNPTVQTSPHASASASVKPSATASVKPSATATVKPSESATAKPSSATVSPSATAKP